MKYRTKSDSIEAIQWTGTNLIAIQDWLTAHARPWYLRPSQPQGFHTPQLLYTRLVGNTLCIDIGTSFGYRAAETGNWFLMTWAGLSVLSDELFKRNYSLELSVDNNSYAPDYAHLDDPTYWTERDDDIADGVLRW